MKKFEAFQLNQSELQSLKGGDGSTCYYSESEIRFLMDANNWSRSYATYVMELACKYAVTPT